MPLYVLYLMKMNDENTRFTPIFFYWFSQSAIYIGGQLVVQSSRAHCFHNTKIRDSLRFLLFSSIFRFFLLFTLRLATIFIQLSTRKRRMIDGRNSFAREFSASNENSLRLTKTHQSNLKFAFAVRKLTSESDEKSQNH